VPARIAPATPPYAAPIQSQLDRLMPPGRAPLALFTTLARDARLFERFMRGGLLDRGHLTLRQREIVIGRVTASCRAEYEWGVHVAFFGERVGIDPAAQRALVHGDAEAPCWSGDERLLIRLCDSLHETCDVDDALWGELAEHFAAEAIIELVMLAGQYRMVSCVCNALRLPLESYAARFPPP
jgi:alkylhydroperoxidase family enzyme